MRVRTQQCFLKLCPQNFWPRAEIRREAGSAWGQEGEGVKFCEPENPSEAQLLRLVCSSCREEQPWGPPDPRAESVSSAALWKVANAGIAFWEAGGPRGRGCQG